MLNFLKLFAQLVIGLWPDRLLEFGEDHGVLARSMRLIHARECSHRSGKPFTVAAGDAAVLGAVEDIVGDRSEEHTSELQSLMRISYAVFCLKKQIQNSKSH